MMSGIDKRTYKREDVQKDITMIINNESISCRVQNMSSAGALIRMESESIKDPAAIEIGIDIEIFYMPEKPGIKGRILRQVHDGDLIFLAVCFLERCQFE